MRYGKHKESKKITEEEVRKAVNGFVKKGGLIKRLPNQVAIRSDLVGARHGTYEELFLGDGGAYQGSLIN